MSLEAEQEMWAAIASQPSPAVCSRCGRELGTGLPSPCSECGPAGGMSRGELDSLTVVRRGDGAELRNSAGFVAWFPDRDEAYAEVRRLRGLV